MKIRPVGGWILLKLEPEPKPKGRIVMLNKPAPVRTGTIEAVGPGCWGITKKSEGKRIPMGVKIGDRIAFFKMVADTKQGQVLRYYLGEDHVLIREPDILMRLDGKVEITV